MSADVPRQGIAQHLPLRLRKAELYKEPRFARVLQEVLSNLGVPDHRLRRIRREHRRRSSPFPSTSLGTYLLRCRVIDPDAACSAGPFFVVIQTRAQHASLKT
jgi:hypothetical protein